MPSRLGLLHVVVVLTPPLMFLLLPSACGFRPSLPQRPQTLGSKAVQLSHAPLFARKKRRRKQQSRPPPPDASSSSSSSSSGSPSDQLPDFDLEEEDEVEKAKIESPLAKQKPTTASSADPLGEISANMMGTTDRPTKSVNELLSDRSLESKMQFDEEEASAEGGEELPDLVALAKRQREEERQTGLPSSTTSKKRARQQARRAAAEAAAAKEEEKEGESILSNLPFIIRDQDGKITPLTI